MTENSTQDSGKRRSRILWDKDGVDGGPSSLKILLDWMEKDGNYGKFKSILYL